MKNLEPRAALKDPTTSRVGPALAVIATVTLLSLMPDRYRIMPFWFPYLAVVVTLGPMVMHYLTPQKMFWQNVEQPAIKAAISVTTLGNIVALGFLLHELLFKPNELHGTPLLTASVAIWVSNIVIFALLYWLIDRNGPDARAKKTFRYADFLFPEAADPESVPPDWQPAFVDYLFLAFTGATGFGLTHTVPITRRAKLLMMVESQISLVTIVVVGARAVSILQ